MTPRRGFRIFYAPVVKEHLRIVERKYYGLIKREIELQLADAPDQESTNRKRLGPTIEVEAEWELRCGPNTRSRVVFLLSRQGCSNVVRVIDVKRGSRL